MLVEDWYGDFNKGFKYLDGDVEPIILENPEENVGGRMTLPFCEYWDVYHCTGTDTGMDPEYNPNCEYSYTIEVCTGPGGGIGGGDPIDYPPGDGGNNGGSGGNPCPPESLSDGNGNCITLGECAEGYVLDNNGNCILESNLAKIMRCENLSDVQLDTLSNVLDEYIERDCHYSTLFNFLVDNGKTICFEMGTPDDEPGVYNTLTSSIHFKDSEHINFTTLAEELFHAYQDEYYGGIAQYMEVGRSNIEFEAKLFQDFVNGGVSCCMVFRNSEVFTEYFIWLLDVTNEFSNIPAWNDISDKYFYYLDEFKIDKPDYAYPTIYDMLPDALLNMRDCQ